MSAMDAHLLIVDDDENIRRFISLLLTENDYEAATASDGQWGAGSTNGASLYRQACAGCHGVDGKAIAPEYPNLGGQYESYLVKSLRDYRDGRRNNPIMSPMAANLTDQDIEDLAAWYASQKGLRDLKMD